MSYLFASKAFSHKVLMFEKIKEKGFHVLGLHHAEAILTHDMSTAIDELESVLLGISIPVEELVRGGGGV
jgi:hypothetical protein